VLPKALPQPFIEPIETSPAARLANRHSATHRKIALDRIPAAPQRAGNPLRPPAQPSPTGAIAPSTPPRSAPASSPPTDPTPAESFAQKHLVHSSSFRRGQFLMSSRGQFSMSPDTVAPHPASRRRSYLRLQAGVGIPGGTSTPDQSRLQAHGTARAAIFPKGPAIFVRYSSRALVIPA
jgi:hypothetical protein